MLKAGDYFKFLKYTSVKMIRGTEVRNRWLDFVELTDDSQYTRNLDQLMERALREKILVRHKNLVRFRLNSLFQVLISLA